jgi:thiol peroxidase
MAKITLKGNAINTIGELPKVGSKLKDFKLVKGDLSRVSLKDFEGKKLVLNIFPSIDTGTCAASVRKFNQEAAALENTVVLNISRDLPFAQNRFCGAEGIDNAITLSDFEDGSFSKDNGLYDHIKQAVEASDTYREILADQLNLYHSSMSTKLNDVMKLLTIFSAIFIPLTFIAGIYGMNFEHMPELRFEYGYYVVIGVMLMTIIGMLYYFKRKDWF